jgi:hypothetical protein
MAVIKIVYAIVFVEPNLPKLIKYGVGSPKFICASFWLETLQPPPPRFWAHIRGRCWSAKIDDISL